MKILLRLMVTFMMFLGVANAQNGAKAMIIFDASGSMWGQIGGVAKITIAKKAMADVVNGWNDSVDLGLTVYGHRKKGDCSDMQTIIPISKVNKSKMISTVKAISPKGKTPIARSLKQVASKLRGNLVLM